jgi:hypothetical protein
MDKPRGPVQKGPLKYLVLFTRWLGQTIYRRQRWLVSKFYSPRRIRNVRLFSHNWNLYQTGKNPSSLLECIDVFGRMCGENPNTLIKQTLDCRYIFRINFSDYQKLAEVKEKIKTSQGFEMNVVSRDFSLQTIGLRLIEEISSQDGQSYIFRSRLKLLKDTAIRPSTWKPSLSRSFVVSVNQTSENPSASTIPFITQFRMHESLDFWSRTAVSKSNDDKSPQVNSLSIALLAQKGLLKHPIVQLMNNDFRSFIDFLAITSNTTVTRTLLGPLQNTIFIRAIELIAGETNSVNSSEPLCQMMLKGSSTELHPIYSHNEFSFDNVSTLNNVEIWHERFVVMNNQVVCREDAADLRADWPAGLWMYKWGHSTIANGVLITEPTKSEKTIDKAIAGFGRCDANWFHFNIETLPRILIASEIADRSVPVLVQSDIPRSAVDAIIATTGREVVKIEDDFLRVNELLVAQAKSATMDSAFLGAITGDFTTSALASVKESLLKALPPEAGGEKRIVLLRQGAYRRIKNNRRVLSVLHEHGFVSIDIGSLSLREQISVINNAEVIVSQGGAGVTNMLFANENASFLGLIGPAKNQSLFWENFLNVLNIRNSFIIGRHVGEKNRVLVHSDFVIPIKELRSTLQQL